MLLLFEGQVLAVLEEVAAVLFAEVVLAVPQLAVHEG